MYTDSREMPDPEQEIAEMIGVEVERKAKEIVAEGSELGTR